VGRSSSSDRFAEGRVLKGLILLVMVLALMGAAEAPVFRFARPLQGARGWSRIELPDDVVDACRPGLPDLRVLSPDGAEIPFAIEHALGELPAEWVVRDVETKEGRETTAIVDRGAHPSPVTRVQIVVAGDDYLKPVVIEASDDRASWGEIARGSIFATDKARMSTLRFAPSDRRYFRLRLDDRFGPPLAPRAVMTTGSGDDGAQGRREVNVPAERVSESGGKSVYALTLTSHAVSRVRIAPSEAAFSRTARIYERIFFHDELGRRLVGSATLVRAPGQRESLDVPIGDLTSRHIEIEIDDGGSPPLTFAQVSTTVEHRSLLFFAQVSGAAELVYGAPRVGPPRYDLTAALALGRPTHVEPVRVGPATDRGGAAPDPAGPARGASVDPSQWRRRMSLRLPQTGNVAYVALDALDGVSEAALRIVDDEAREVPYVVEQTIRHTRHEAKAEVAQVGSRTVVTIVDLASLRAIDGVELTATTPDAFTRAVTVVEATRDAGTAGERILGSATWERRAGEPAAPFTIAIAPPAETSIEVRIENGENTPIVPGTWAIVRASRRLDFVFTPGERLALLTGNPGAAQPTYDQALLVDAVLAAPAQAATLEPKTDDSAPEPKGLPKWIWACVILGGLVIATMLTRSMRGAPPD
jgi:hypothetical protein